MKWLAVQDRIRNSRSLAAESVSKTAWEDEEELEALLTTRVSDDGDEYLNFSKQEAKAVCCPWLPDACLS
jgi:chaperone BCS1